MIDPTKLNIAIEAVRAALDRLDDFRIDLAEFSDGLSDIANILNDEVDKLDAVVSQEDE